MQTAQKHWTIQDLANLLEQEEWQAADAVTLWLMLEATHRQAERWLNLAAIANLPCPRLHQIDRLWVDASQGQFGFSVQERIYTQESNSNTFQFCQKVGWLLLNVRPLAFFKFYDFLNFDLEAPPGHLPALWYWRLSPRESWQAGGFGTGRGAAFGDTQMLDAMMLRWQRCSFL